MTVAGQPPVSYSYDSANRLTSIVQGPSIVAFTYDNAGRRNTLTYPNGIVATSTYDSANQLTNLAYTLNGNPVGDLTYAYDAAGKRTSVGGTWARTGLPPALAAATYDAANRVTTRNGVNLSHDLNGNLIGDGLSTYSWNARNQLVALSGGTAASFNYDGLGRRRAKTVSGTTSNFLYDGLNLVQELTSGGTPTANLLGGLGIDEVFTRIDAAAASTLLVDALSSTLALTDASGVVQTQYTFAPFGATTASGASNNAAQFTGRENDDTGLYAYRARYYSPLMQRFISEDPLSFASGQLNLYGYVGNTPTRFRDPLGLQAAVIPGIEIGGAVGGVPGAVIGGVIGGIAGWILGDAISDIIFNDFPDPFNPPSQWRPRPGSPDTWVDPTTGETWHWHPDPERRHGGDHWDIGGQRPQGGGKGAQDWWPRGGSRGPKPPGGMRMGIPVPEGPGRKDH